MINAKHTCEKSNKKNDEKYIPGLFSVKNRIPTNKYVMRFSLVERGTY